MGVLHRGTGTGMESCLGHVETVAEWFRTAAPEQGTVARVVTELYDAAYRPRAVAILIFDPLGLL